LAITGGLLFLGGHFYGLEMASAEAPPAVAAEPPLLRRLVIVPPVHEPALAAPGEIAKTMIPQTLPDAIPEAWRPPANGVPPALLYAAEVPDKAPASPPEPAPRPRHAALADSQRATPRAVADKVSAKTVRRSAPPVARRPCIRIYPELGRCH
jgi:hypothetical protein